MRLSVRRRRVCAGEERRTLRKSAFWRHDLTERRILREWRGQSALLRESDTPRVRLYVSRRLRRGALVYAAAPLRTDVGMQECTQIGENGLSTPFWGTCVHCCDAIRRGVNPHEPPKDLIQG